MKRFAILMILALSLMLTGCMKEINLSDDDTDVIAEYIAKTILMKQEDYNPTFHETLDMESTTEEVTPEPTTVVEKPQNNKDGIVAEKPSQEKPEQHNSSIEDVLGIQHFTVEYTGYGLYDTYPDDESMVYFTLQPTKTGNQLLVVTFKATNTTKKERNLSMQNKKVSYQLDINTGKIFKPLFTLMPNDLQYIDTMVKAKESLELVLIFEVSEDVNLDKINLMMSRDDEARIIKIK